MLLFSWRSRQAWFSQLVENNIGKVQQWLDKLAAKDPAKAADLLIKLMEFTTPKLARSEITGLDGDALTIKVIKFGDCTPEQLET